MTEGFDGIFKKRIEFEHIKVDVTYNPYSDEWRFGVKDSTFIFKEVPGKMVYKLLSVMKWAEEVDVVKLSKNSEDLCLVDEVARVYGDDR